MITVWFSASIVASIFTIPISIGLILFGVLIIAKKEKYFDYYTRIVTRMGMPGYADLLDESSAYFVGGLCFAASVAILYFSVFK